MLIEIYSLKKTFIWRDDKVKRILTFILVITLIAIVSLSPVFAQEDNKIRVEKASIKNEIITKISNGAVIPMRAQYGEITADNVRLRKSPGLSSTVLMYLHTGYIVTCPYVDEVYKDGMWWKNVIYEGVGGWVASEYVYEYGR